MKLAITMLIHNKDDIELVTEFPCRCTFNLRIKSQNLTSSCSKLPFTPNAVPLPYRILNNKGINLQINKRYRLRSCILNTRLLSSDYKSFYNKVLTLSLLDYLSNIVRGEMFTPHAPYYLPLERMACTLKKSRPRSGCKGGF